MDLQVRSALGMVSRTALKRGSSLTLRNAVDSRHNCALLRTFDCGHEKGKRSQAKKGKNSRTSATRCRRIDEAGNRKKKERRRKERKKEGFAEVLLDESMVPSCFSTPGIYLSRVRTHNVRRYIMAFKDAKCIASLSFSLNTSRSLVFSPMRDLQVEFFNYFILKRKTGKEQMIDMLTQTL